MQTVNTLSLGLVGSNMVPVPVRCSKLWVNVTLGLLYFCAIWPHRWSHQGPTAAVGWRPPLWLHQRQLHWCECFYVHTHTAFRSKPISVGWCQMICFSTSTTGTGTFVACVWVKKQRCSCYNNLGNLHSDSGHTFSFECIHFIFA